MDEVIESVLRQTYRNREILLVDNHSLESAKIAALVAQYPAVRLIQIEQNVGFAEGMNRGVRAASGEYVFLTEDDMVLDAECLRNFVLCAPRYPQLTIFSGIELNKRERTVRFAGAKLALGGIFQFSVLKGEQEGGLLDEPYETEYIPGNMMFGKTELLRLAGPFRSDFFMYHEDTEFAIRVRRMGALMMIVPSSRAWHFEPLTDACSELIEFHKLKNFLALYLLHAPAAVLPEALVRYALLPFLQAVARDRRRALLLLRSFAHTMRHLKQLTRERREIRTQQVDIVGTIPEARLANNE